MTYIISIAGDQLSGIGNVYLKVESLENETLFRLDRKIREAIHANPRTDWEDISQLLAKSGFQPIPEPDGYPVYMHPRPWDEHLNSSQKSFFVTFGDDSPYELTGQLLFATSRPQNYTNVSADYVGKNKVVIITHDHEAVYHDDVAWSNPTHAEKIPIGQVTLIPDQFYTEKEYTLACNILKYSGYIVSQLPRPKGGDLR